MHTKIHLFNNLENNLNQLHEINIHKNPMKQLGIVGRSKKILDYSNLWCIIFKTCILTCTQQFCYSTANYKIIQIEYIK